MRRYLVALDHAPDKRACLEAVREVLGQGSHFVTHAEWGCPDGVHTAWILVDAESHDEARRVLPPHRRAEATVTRVARFRLEEIEALLARHGG